MKKVKLVLPEDKKEVPFRLEHLKLNLNGKKPKNRKNTYNLMLNRIRRDWRGR